jgi:peptide chain release factor 2
MNETQKQANDLKSRILEAFSKLDIAGLQKELELLRERSNASDFWTDRLAAEETMRRMAGLETRVQPWLSLKHDLDETLELAEMNDDSLAADIKGQINELGKKFNELKVQLKFSGPYDAYDAIITIHAGAGGTDAQDWAQMLMRMYGRWADGQGFKTQMIDESPGEEAGIKSATLGIDGSFAYGQLKGEHGVHRLVRLSPFNADSLRQTSFARVEVVPKIAKPEEVEIDDGDLKIDVYRSGGHGGQSVNTTDSAVRITHLPTGISVAIQNERSQLQNKETALTILRSKLAQLQLEQHKEKLSELKGPAEQAAWGNQIRNYVLHPYKQVKDVRTGYESKDPDKVLGGELNGFINAYLEQTLSQPVAK